MKNELLEMGNKTAVMWGCLTVLDPHNKPSFGRLLLLPIFFSRNKQQLPYLFPLLPFLNFFKNKINS